MLPADWSHENLLTKVVDSNIFALSEMKQNLTNMQFEKAAEMILNAKEVFLFGIGASNMLAAEAADYFYRLGLHCHYSQDYHQLIEASFAEKDDIAILISQTGVNKDILQISQILKDRDISSIGISNYTTTPFTKYVSLLIAPFSNLASNHDNNFSSRIPILGIIETLYYQIADKMGSSYFNAIKNNEDIIKNQAVK